MSNLVDGRYQLIDVIGAGGMATVWRAQDLRLNRMVALKRPRPAQIGSALEADAGQPGSAPLDPSMLQARMSREMQLAASLSHPNLVTVHDAGHDADGLYLVMELVDAPSLAEVIVRSGRLDRGKALTIGAEIADALAAVHKVGIVHRDVKPGNILLADAGAKLTDFGIATDSGTDATAQTSLTVAGSVLATFNYASAEVLAGQKPTDRSDVYSLASVVYQMLTGRLPFADTGRLGPPATCGEASLDNIFAEALAHDSWRRPDSATFAGRLRAANSTTGPAAPLSAYPAVADSTSPLAVPPPVEAPPVDRVPPPGPDRTAAMPMPAAADRVVSSPGATQALPPHLQPGATSASRRPSAGPPVVGRPLLPEAEPAAPRASWPDGSGRPGGRAPGRPGVGDRSSSSAGGRLAIAAVVLAVMALIGFLGVRALQGGDPVETTGSSLDDGDGNRVDAGEGDDITPQTLPSTTTTTEATVDPESDGEGNDDAQSGDDAEGEGGDPLTRTLDDLEDALDRADEQFDDSGLPSDDVEDLLERARDAIDSARDSDELENVRRLDELRRQIDDVVGDDSEDSPRGRFERLARFLGLGDDDSDEGDSEGTDSGDSSGG